MMSGGYFGDPEVIQSMDLYRNRGWFFISNSKLPEVVSSHGKHLPIFEQDHCMKNPTWHLFYLHSIEQDRLEQKLFRISLSISKLASVSSSTGQYFGVAAFIHQ